MAAAEAEDVDAAVKAARKAFEGGPWYVRLVIEGVSNVDYACPRSILNRSRP